MNDAPSADDQSVIVRAGTPAPIALSAHDVDGDTLTYSVSAGPAHGTLSGTAPNLFYTPATGYVGTDSFTFIARDATVNSPAATVQLDVRAAGRAPEAEDQWMIIDEDTTVEITLSAGDPEGDPLTFTIVTPPTHGTLSGTLPNLVYTPDPDFEGEDRFTFRASDGLEQQQPRERRSLDLGRERFARREPDSGRGRAGRIGRRAAARPSTRKVTGCSTGSPLNRRTAPSPSIR